MNWAASTAVERVRKQGAEMVDGLAHGSPRPGRKTNRRMPSRRGPTLDEPVVVDKWWKNRGGDAVFVRLSTYEQHNIIDVRTWRANAEGISQPGKGFAASVQHLPRLIDALTKALNTARELGLIREVAE